MGRDVERQRFIGDPAEHFVQVEGEDFVAPIEAMDKERRQRVLGFFQMKEEVLDHQNGSIPRSIETDKDLELIERLAKAYGDEVWAMREQLTRDSGMGEFFVDGILIDWLRMKPRTEEDMERIWTGE